MSEESATAEEKETRNAFHRFGNFDRVGLGAGVGTDVLESHHPRHVWLCVFGIYQPGAKCAAGSFFRPGKCDR